MGDRLRSCLKRLTVLATFSLISARASLAIELKPDTIAAFNKFIESAELRLQSRFSGQTFLLVRRGFRCAAAASQGYGDCATDTGEMGSFPSKAALFRIGGVQFSSSTPPCGMPYPLSRITITTATFIGLISRMRGLRPTKEMSSWSICGS